MCPDDPYPCYMTKLSFVSMAWSPLGCSVLLSVLLGEIRGGSHEGGGAGFDFTVLWGCVQLLHLGV